MIKAPHPCLWFDDQAEQAAEFYTRVIPNSRIVETTRYPAAGQDVTGKPAGSVMTVIIELNGAPVMLLNGGPQFSFDEAMSLVLACDSQEEIDELWDALVDGGGEHGPCGWLKDRFGLSWQVVPAGLDELFASSAPEARNRAMEAMLQMGKLDLAELRRAAEGVGAGAS